MLGILLAAAIAPGTYTYTATLAGANVGTSTLVVKSVGTSTEIDEKVTGTISGSDASANDTLVLGADLGPLTYEMSATEDGSPLKDSATVANTTANVVDVHGKSESFDLAAPTKHFVVADFGLFAGLLPLPAQMHEWNNSPVLVVVPMLGRSAALAPDATARAKRPTTVPASDVALVFTGEAPFTIWYDPTTLVPDEIDVSAQGIVVTRQR
ncbi:MAG TPA: hypothetical protein VF741_08795 [Candidatus Aquilonibacter sp.]